jgi:hypothetical protein
VTEVHYGGDLYALMGGGEAEVVNRIVGNREGMKIDLANAKVFARLDLFDAIAQNASTPARLVAELNSTRKPPA